MGLFSFLFGKNNQRQSPQIQSIYPQGAVLKVQSGILPTIQADKIVLGKGEVCHFIERAIIITEKKIRTTKHVGGSYHFGGGFTMHSGDSVSTPTVEPEYTKGIFYITNQRVVFVATKNGFDKQIKKITAITPYSNGIDLQYGSKTYSLFLPDGDIAKHVLDLIL